MTPAERAAYEYGQAIAKLYPARRTGSFTAGRRIGLNPFDLWTPAYYAFNSGYEEKASEMLNSGEI